MNQQKGFTAIEGLLLLVIIGMLGFTGWFVWHSQQSTSKTNQQSVLDSNPVSPTTKGGKQFTQPTTQKSDPYAAWKTFTSKAEKFSIRYPSNWKVDNWSTTDCANGPNGQCYEAYDFIAPNGLRVRYNQTLAASRTDDRGACGHGSACDDQKVYSLDNFKVVNYGNVEFVKLLPDALSNDPTNCPNFYLHVPASSGTTPKVGDNQYKDHFIDFSLPSKTVNGRYEIWLTNQTGSDVTFSCKNISAKNFFNLPTVIEAEKVLRSLTY